MAGYLTVLKNNFAGTQAAEMGEDPPLTYFCRSRGTCDITSARSKQSRRGGIIENRPRKYRLGPRTVASGRRKILEALLKPPELRRLVPILSF